ncbi:MAG: chemotaxis protein CheX [Candidatus Wallacebacter cryptica]|nr:chemotaxis protein CheX [Bacillota bacterium]
MRVAYVEPFVRAARDVFKLMMDLEATRGELWACDELMPSKEASVAIGVTGDLLGSILYSFPKEMTLKMVEIMSGMAIEELDSFVASALGEVANIISGNAVTHLSNNNYNCNIVPPQIVLGKNVSLSMASKRALVVPMETRIGQFDIFITLSER